uniref:MAM domain-containing protein n=1 Tax=Steinernema glaseri TaxID=37863 RepID=A0A1I7YTF3_9BILA
MEDLLGSLRVRMRMRLNSGGEVMRSDIKASGDLNCDFNQRCRWRNGTGLEDSGEWLVSNVAPIDTQRQIESMHTGSNDQFGYTFGMNGRQSAILISDVISCQLGGAKLKFWYWKTDATTTLEVCIRQPPGNPDPSKLHCYNALSGTHAQQWIYIAVELPPMSQPFELVIRAFFTQPVDIIAIDDISYDAILCGGRKYRRKRVPENLPVIAFKDWEQLRKSTQTERLPTMLVVAEPEPSIAITEHQPVTTTTTTMPTLSETSTAETTFSPSTSMPMSLEQSTPLSLASGNQSLDHMNNLMNFLKQAAPLLPVIPVLVRSLHSTDTQGPATQTPNPLQGLMQFAGLGSSQAFVPPAAAAGTPIYSNKKVNGLMQFAGLGSSQAVVPPAAAAGTPIYSNKKVNGDNSFTPPIQFNGLSNLINKLAPTSQASFGTPLPNYGSPDLNKAVDQQELVEESPEPFVTEGPAPESSTVYPQKVANLYGVQTNRVAKKVDEHYMAPLPPNIKEKAPRKSLGEDSLDISSLTTSEIRQLEAIHRKIFNSSESEAKKVKTSSTGRSNIASNVRLIKPEPPTTTTSHPLTIFRKSANKSAKKSPELIGQLTDLTNNLTPDILNDLTMLKDIPNLEELTEGMDLSLLNRPGGFAQLKQQFIERLLRRNMGLPVNKTVNSGTSAGAGGNYETTNIQPPNRAHGEHSYSQDKSGFIPEYVDPVVPESSSDASYNQLARPTSLFEVNSSGIRRQHSRKEPHFKSLCPTVDCNFDDNTFCGYSATILGTDEDLLLGVQPKIHVKSWILSDRRVSNSLTGIPADLTGGYFAYAGETQDPHDVFVLTTSETVRFEEEAKLELRIFLAGAYGRFRVCLNGFSECPISISGSDLTVNARQWSILSANLQPGSYKIHLIADQLRKNYVIGLDQIQLVNKYRSGSVQCKY